MRRRESVGFLLVSFPLDLANIIMPADGILWLFIALGVFTVGAILVFGYTLAGMAILNTGTIRDAPLFFAAKEGDSVAVARLLDGKSLTCSLARGHLVRTSGGPLGCWHPRVAINLFRNFALPISLCLHFATAPF